VHHGARHTRWRRGHRFSLQRGDLLCRRALLLAERSTRTISCRIVSTASASSAACALARAAVRAARPHVRRVRLPLQPRQALVIAAVDRECVESHHVTSNCVAGVTSRCARSWNRPTGTSARRTTLHRLAFAPRRRRHATPAVGRRAATGSESSGIASSVIGAGRAEETPPPAVAALSNARPMLFPVRPGQVTALTHCCSTPLRSRSIMTSCSLTSCSIWSNKASTAWCISRRFARARHAAASRTRAAWWVARPFSVLPVHCCVLRSLACSQLHRYSRQTAISPLVSSTRTTTRPGSVHCRPVTAA